MKYLSLILVPIAFFFYSQSPEEKDMMDTLKNNTNIVLHKKDNHIYRKRKLSNSLDLSSYNKIHEITKDYIDVDGLVRFDDLLDYTLEYGFMPQIVPELRSITVGGAIAGVGIESSSFKYGLFHDSVIEYNVLTGNGDIIVCNNETNNDLFYGMPNSYGTLGYILKAKVKIVKVKPFVELKNIHYRDPQKFISEIEKYKFNKEDFDFIDGTIFDKENMYISLAKFTEKINQEPSKYIEDIYYHSVKEKKTDYMKIKDYVWRYDSNYFYIGGDSNSIFQNKIIRKMFSRFLRSDYMRLLDTNIITSKLLSWLMVDSESIVNDLSIDTKYFTSFLKWYDDKINTYPVWICPYHTQRDTFFTEKDKYSIDFGIGFGVTKCNDVKEDKSYYKKLIDNKMYEMKRKKGLYSTTTLNYDKFHDLYNPDKVYEKLKEKYDTNNRFPTLYDKICNNI